ncbi:MAG: patatin-like phospholipase family protein, partial [Verrucomicrobiae bacterium]|nr:patatin-like phospholipase family protein [Verrucomicrobiae bacterium]
MKRALVLGGGGARGAFQVGMLYSLVIERGLDFQVIRGISVGALNAAFLAQAPSGGSTKDSLTALQRRVIELERLWRTEIKGNHSVYAERPGGVLGLAAGADSLYSLEPLKRLLQKHLSVAALRSSGRDFKVGTVSLLTGLYQEWGPDDPAFVDKVLASASIPVVFPFVKTAQPKDVLVDGGVRNITPLSSAFDAEPDEIYVLLTSRLVRTAKGLPESGVQEHAFEQWDDAWLGTKVSGFDVLKRTLEILTDEVYLDDIRGALAWNSVLEAINEVTEAVPASLRRRSRRLDAALEKLRRSTRKRFVRIHVLAPQVWYGQANSAT